MLRVVLADDEKKIIFLMQKLIDWEELGYEIAGVANDGISALELVKELNPDVLVTDIKMPGCNGIELIRQVKEIRTDIHIIIISGYREFDYAQKALKYGVDDYLLKPLKKDEVTKILNKIRGKTTEKKISEKKSRKTAEKREELMLLRLKECALEDIPFVERRQLNDEYGLDLKDGACCVIAVKPDISNGWSRTEEYKILMQHSLEIVRREMSGITDKMAAASFEEGILLVVQIQNYSQVEMHQVMTRIRKGIEQQRDLFWGIRVTIAAGSVRNHTEELSISMREAIWLCLDRLCSKQLLRNAENDYPASVKQYQLPPFMKRRFQSSCEILDKDRFEKELMSSCDTLRELESLNGGMVKDWFMQVLSASVSGLQLDDARSFTEKLEKQFWKCSSVDEIYEMLLKELLAKMQEIREERERSENRPITQAKEYMQRHYMEECKLEDVSAWVGFNTTYFSTLFKKETGSSFTDYLTELRIGKAKELLCRDNLSIPDICEEVGYKDMKYFSRLFKKNAGVTPSEYRKMYQ